MIDFIQSETKKMMYGCCERHSKKNQVDIEDVQLILGLGDEQDNTYIVCEKYRPKASLDIMGVLGVRVDFLGYSRLAPPFIKKSLIRFSEAHQIDLDKVKIMCIPTKNEKDKPDVLLFLYNEMSYVETITFSDLFREEDIEIPT
jgi:hypothetical protein